MKTVTFYSYKGGTGRTLMVANAAHFLAWSGFNVVVLDFDLEAPGLHYKLQLGRTNKDKHILGLLDIIESFIETATIPDLNSYLLPVEKLPPKSRGWAKLLPAGNAPSSKYSRQLVKIRQHDIFDVPSDDSKYPLALPLFLELKDRISQEYKPDYLLIDSRTGLTEIGGVALRLIPDTVVCLLHNNPENLAGAREVLRSVIRTQRQEKEPIQVVAAVARVPELPYNEETEFLDRIRDRFNEQSQIPKATLNLPEILSLRSDPNLITEKLLIGCPIATANQSVLLRDYFRLFQRLGFDQKLPEEDRKVLDQLANADRNEKIRPLLHGGRQRGWESTYNPVDVETRISLRPKKILKIVCPEYATGSLYNEFVQLVLGQLSKTTSIPGDSFDRLPSHGVRWDLLAVHLREGVIDFCADLYYLTENRSHLVDVVQLGWCHSFTIFVRNGSQVHQSLYDAVTSSDKDIKTEHSDKKHKLPDLKGPMLKLLKALPRTAIGVLGDTPAASEVNKALSSHIAAAQLISKGSEEDLFDWLNEPPDRDCKIVICDHVVTTKMNEVAKESQSLYSSDIVFPFAQPIPLGLAYPRENLKWRTVLSRVIADSVLKFVEEHSWDEKQGVTNSMAADFATNHTEALDFADLRSSLLLDLPFNEATEWNRKLNRVLEKSKNSDRDC